ncbi:MAG: hypothetical protein NkDv07_0790 [Candidatus Improbicoccus devescovinae]|nr:MAG: hypothetical protein NkDv07_0464 [Candidatus Improbicoccus devescovinae]GMB10859.1 MAG: hypothetical protein NkDv07_0790 [Candidatus Improbicoccus devescovinae]
MSLWSINFVNNEIEYIFISEVYRELDNSNIVYVVKERDFNGKIWEKDGKIAQYAARWADDEEEEIEYAGEIEYSEVFNFLMNHSEKSKAMKDLAMEEIAKECV